MRTALMLTAAGALLCALPATNAHATEPAGAATAPSTTTTTQSTSPGTATTSPPSAAAVAATPATPDGAQPAERTFEDEPWARDRELDFRLSQRLGALPQADVTGVRAHARRGGVVVLYGTVRNAAALDRVLLAANAVDGVRVVRNELVVGAAEAATAESPTARGGGPAPALDAAVRAALRNDPGVVGRPLRVSARGNTVTLQGRVATYADAYRITERARAVPGVAVVRPALVVNQSYLIDIDSDHGIARLYRPQR